MNILITGGTGFIGSALQESLIHQGHSIVVLTRNPQKVGSDVKGIRDLSQLSSEECFDAVINLAGEPIADKRWSEAQKAKILNSRLGTTQQLIDFFTRLEKKPSVFISGSAIGYYGIESSDKNIDEDGVGDESFASQLCQQWESIANTANAMDIRTCILRTGIVLGSHQGALKKMLPPFKLGLGGKIGDGSQWMPWIHINDMINIILLCLEKNSVTGAVNCTAPNPVSNVEFTQALGRVLNRPTLLSVPAVVIKLLMGEMGQELLLSGKKVVPEKLTQMGFKFKYGTVEAALKDVAA